MIEINSLLLFLGVLAICLVLKLIWELILLVKRVHQSLNILDQTMETYQSLATKTSETLEEVDVILGDAQCVADDYHVIKGEVFSLGTKAGEVVTHVLSQIFK